MKAAIALLADYPVQNYVRRIVFELEQQHPIDFLAALLPAHVSLKQPFAFEDMQKLEDYFAALAASLPPLPIELDEIYYAEWAGYGILGLSVKNTSELRVLHNRINDELKQLFADTTAAHDGEGYHFHMTIELGKLEKGNPYRTYYEGLAEKKVNLSFLAEQIALFYYTGESHHSFMCYKVLPLAGKGNP